MPRKNELILRGKRFPLILSALFFFFCLSLVSFISPSSPFCSSLIRNNSVPLFLFSNFGSLFFFSSEKNVFHFITRVRRRCLMNTGKKQYFELVFLRKICHLDQTSRNSWGTMGSKNCNSFPIVVYSLATNLSFINSTVIALIFQLGTYSIILVFLV